jgi:hypothetical protein
MPEAMAGMPQASHRAAKDKSPGSRAPATTDTDAIAPTPIFTSENDDEYPEDSPECR